MTTNAAPPSEPKAPPVRFGLSFGFRNPPPFGRSFADVYADALEIAALADDLGFDSIWISEHHGIEDGYCPAPLAAAAAFAARTKRISIGTKILIAPLHHPLELLEQGAFVDQLSHGRFQMGVGAGYRPEEFEARGVPFGERGRILEETIEILRMGWSDGVVDFVGEHYRFDSVPIYPQPVQRPHPKIWIGAGRGKALERAVRLGFPLMLGSAEDGYREYLDGVTRGGADPDAAEIIHSLSALHVAEDGDSARTDSWPGVAWLQHRPMGVTPPLGELTRPDAYPCDVNVGHASYAGSPDEVAGALLEMDQRTPLRHVTFHAMVPGLPVDAVARSLELFMNEVVPRVTTDSVRGRAAAELERESR